MSPRVRRRAASASAHAMPCPECGESLRITRQPHRYSLTPKWAITIEGAEVRRCGKCGYFEIVIPRPEALHRTIAAEVIRKPARLSGPEVVFLRSQLGMTARALAKAMGVVPETLSAIAGASGPMKLVVRVDHQGGWRRAA